MGNGIWRTNLLVCIIRKYELKAKPGGGGGGGGGGGCQNIGKQAVRSLKQMLSLLIYQTKLKRRDV